LFARIIAPAVAVTLTVVRLPWAGSSGVLTCWLIVTRMYWLLRAYAPL
jgi:hypothetical protein